MPRHVGEDRLALRLKPQRKPAALRAGGRLAGPTPTQIGLVDERDAHREPLGDLAGRLAGIERRHHLVPQILRIRPTRTPPDLHLRSKPETDESQKPPLPEAKIDSGQSDCALVFNEYLVPRGKTPHGALRKSWSSPVMAK